jgi:hypothetical protein
MLILSALGFLHLRHTPPKPSCWPPGNGHDHWADWGVDSAFLTRRRAQVAQIAPSPAQRIQLAATAFGR